MATKITKEEYEKYLLRDGTWEKGDYEIVECNCSFSECRGWRVAYSIFDGMKYNALDGYE